MSLPFELSVLSLATVGNFGLLLINLGIFWSTVFQLQRLRRKEQQFDSEYSAKLAAANDQAAKILSAASEKAQQLIETTQVDLTDVKKKLEKSVTQTAQQQGKALYDLLQELAGANQEFLAGMQDQLKTDTKSLVDTIIANTKAEIERFVVSLKTETKGVQEKFGDRLAGEFNQALVQVKEYRDEQLSLVEKSINKIILSVSQRVLPEAISITEHEQLIFAALEKAKQEALFSTFDLKEKKPKTPPSVSPEPDLAAAPLTTSIEEVTHP